MQAAAPTLNIIGAGRLGRTLARLWSERGVFTIAGLCNRSNESTASAREFIGAGKICGHIADLPDADCWLIATGDADIAATALLLARRLDGQRPLVFHCSGALPASVLEPCRPATLASAHPVHSFAEPQHSLEAFAGSTVTLEGDDEGRALLGRAFSAVGCELLTLNPQQKVLYHTGSVMACNYLTVLLDQSLKVFAAAGIAESSARKLLEPIVTQTVRNNFALGPARALTGPIARGDGETVARQLHALAQVDEKILNSYRTLGQAGVELAKKSGLDEKQVRQLESILREQAQ
ncbi:Rossmann-like and DUF2520 domain-containing protein [uncultured Microbulbifer sp.]|uniref:Rossmann-like and DUF2520 domain-containing protein n=1 Tax=uncultured Microbulbifer sp. TaxID=348147 RepID=UPI0025CC10DF|nr:Rossmann-like and DUF2520 domain-containing protein [uncultured Microbulbifer sp.]